ncbi:hypothetical protein GCM10008939_03950 [Deinococcus aquiradiocola]|uniref:Uncharacterized protein n=1 Tax=Deinococcus aquiradiocola TaxID=393059 RepID=A0A917P663_9DEIO|nr:hypothetical protein GCM10008939_03950 [Deinococcus aquiradiocola]
MAQQAHEPDEEVREARHLSFEGRLPAKVAQMVELRLQLKLMIHAVLLGGAGQGVSPADFMVRPQGGRAHRPGGGPCLAEWLRWADRRHAN